MRWMWLLGLVGCAGELTPRAASTAAVCGVDAGQPTGHPFGEPELSEPCLEALAADFSVDLPLDPQEATALAGAHALLAYDWGTVEPGASPLDDTLAEVAAVTGDEAVGWLAYDYAAHRIHGIEAGSAGEGGAAKYLHLRRTVVWEEIMPPAAAAGVLVHEARHGDGERHTACHDGTKACDDDWHGAYGFEAALMTRGAEQAQDAVSVSLYDLADEAAARVLID